MKTTRHTSERERLCQAPAPVAFATAVDLRRLPDWWLWREGHERITTSEHEVVDLSGVGTHAAPGVDVEVRASAGSATLKNGREMSWGPKTCRFICEAVVPGRSVRLAVVPGPADEGNRVTALELVIAEDDLGSRVTLRRESAVPGRGLRAALGRQAHERGLALDGPLKRFVAICETTPSAN